MVATAHESGLTQSVNITEGGRGGLELITNKAQQSAKDIAKKASELIYAKTGKRRNNNSSNESRLLFHYLHMKY